MKRIVLALALIFFSSSAVFAGEEITLMIPKAEKTKTASGAMTYKLDTDNGEQEYVEIGLREFIRKFEGSDYKIEQIELWIEGKAESSNLTKLFVSVSGGGGCKLILKPK